MNRKNYIIAGAVAAAGLMFMVGGAASPASARDTYKSSSKATAGIMLIDGSSANPASAEAMHETIGDINAGIMFNRSGSANSANSAIPASVHYTHRPISNTDAELIFSESGSENAKMTNTADAKGIDIKVSSDNPTSTAKNHRTLADHESPMLIAQNVNVKTPPTASTPTTTSATVKSTSASNYYRAPMDITLLPSANFAEARTNHFHSGVDIKTGGVEGKPLYAVADGHIVRICIAPSGYGRALYIAHPNGESSVYAHMQRFTAEIEKYVDEARYNQKKHNVDLYPSAEKFPVSKGQLIGYSGNSGSSMGPHLHFEIRQTASQKPTNVFQRRILDVKDDLPPTIVKLHYIEVDTLDGVPVSLPPRTYAAVKKSASVFTLSDSTALELGRNGYFVLECTDRKNNSHNTMGMYRVTMSVDGRQVFGFRLDGFLFSETRYVNSFTHYAMQKGQRNEMVKLAVQDNNRLKIYDNTLNRGAVTLSDTLPHNIEIAAHDDNGNISYLTLAVKRRQSGDPAFAPPHGSVKVDWNRHFYRDFGGAEVRIPARILYESIFLTYATDSVPDNKVKVAPLSALHRIHSDDTPLHSYINVAVSAEVPSALRSKVCLARVQANGRFVYAGGKYENGKVAAEVRDFGAYCVVADTVPPTVTPSFANNADLRSVREITFTMADNFSGVKSYTATIDGKWIAFEQQGSKVTHVFDAKRIEYNGGKHTLVFTATDNRGNSTTVRRSFIK